MRVRIKKIIVLAQYQKRYRVESSDTFKTNILRKRIFKYKVYSSAATLSFYKITGM